MPGFWSRILIAHSDRDFARECRHLTALRAAGTGRSAPAPPHCPHMPAAMTQDTVTQSRDERQEKFDVPGCVTKIFTAAGYQARLRRMSEAALLKVESRMQAPGDSFDDRVGELIVAERARRTMCSLSDAELLLSPRSPQKSSEQDRRDERAGAAKGNRMQDLTGGTSDEESAKRRRRNQRHASVAKATADPVTPGFESIHNTTFEDVHADAGTESDGGLFSVPASASSGTLNSPLTRSDDVTWTDLQCATWIVDDNTSAAALLRYLKQSEYWAAAAAVRTDLDVGRSLLDLVEENPDSHIATLRLWAMAVAVHWQFTMASVGCGELLMGVLLHFPVQNKLVIANEAGVNPGYCQTLRTLYSDAGQSSRQMLMSDLFSVQMELTHTAAKCAMLAVLTTRLQTVGLTLAAYTRHSLTAHEELLALYAPERAPTYTFGVNPNRAYEVHRTELPAVEARGTTGLLHPAAGAGASEYMYRLASVWQ